MNSRWRDARNILLVRLDNLGDVLLSTPAFHAVRETNRGSRLTLLTSPVGAQAAELNPDLDDVICYEAPWMDAWNRLPLDSKRELQLIEAIRARRFDAAIIFTSFRQSSLPSAYLCYLADIPLRLASSTDGSGSLLTTRHKHVEDHNMHEVLRALELVGVEGFYTSSTDLVLQLSEHDRSAIKRRLLSEGLSPGKPLVVIHPGCSMPARTYPWEMFAEAADLIVEASGCQAILTGDSREVDLTKRIQMRMMHPALNMAGRVSFKEFSALLSLVGVVVTNNTGPAHVAAAVKTPVVDLFALTNPPEQWRPWNVPHRLLNQQVPCALCYSRVCPTDHRCLRDVRPSDVAKAALELLEVNPMEWRDAG